MLKKNVPDIPGTQDILSPRSWNKWSKCKNEEGGGGGYIRAESYASAPFMIHLVLRTGFLTNLFEARGPRMPRGADIIFPAVCKKDMKTSF